MRIFKKACIDTWKSFGLSLGTVIVLVLVPAIFILLLSYIGEEEKASSEMTDNIVIAIIFILVAIVPTFLWNLLMAPFRLEVERLDEKIDECIHTDTVAPGEEPIEVDVSLYQKHKNLSLSQAACLWFSIDPHQATKDPRIKVMLSQLKNAIIGKDLSSNWGRGISGVLETFAGVQEKIPGDNQQVSMTALRRYAEKIGEVPLFLLHIQLPPESVNDEGNRGRLKPPTPDKSDS